jgi:hypothetical protein
MDNLAGAGGGPHDHGMEMRLQRLEDAIPRIEAFLKSIDERLRRVETELAETKGRVTSLPTTWALLTAIMAGQIAFGGMFAAVLRFAGLH